MAKRFRECSQDQIYLLPPSLQDWLPETHLARFVSEICDSLDLNAFLAKHEQGDGRGLAAYHPVMMLRLLLYGYCIGKRSSRQIEKATHDDVAFRYLAANQHPDHATISAFRKAHLDALVTLFEQVLLLCRKAGLVRLGAIAIDGTKIQANASPEETVRYKQLCASEERLTRRVREMFEEAERVDREEDARYGRQGKPQDLPPELATTQQRIEKIQQAKRQLEEEAKEKADKARAERAASGGKHRNEAAKKRHQRATQPIEKSNPQHNAVDPDSRLMPDAVTGGFVQAFNAQVAVDAQSQIIVSAAVSSEVNDREQLVPMAELTKQMLGARPEVMLADAGYFSLDAVETLAKNGWNLLVTPDGGRKKKMAANSPKGPIAEAMRKRLAEAVEGKIYRLRQETVEPVFGPIKEARGVRRFLMRGLKAVAAEWQIVCLTHNLLKLFRAATTMSLSPIVRL